MELASPTDVGLLGVYQLKRWSRPRLVQYINMAPLDDRAAPIWR